MDDTQADKFKEPSDHSCEVPEVVKFELDREKYLPMVEAFEISEEQKIELLETLWSILQTFVEIGFSVDVCSKLFGSFEDNNSVAETEISSLESSVETDEDGDLK